MGVRGCVSKPSWRQCQPAGRPGSLGGCPSSGASEFGSFAANEVQCGLQHLCSCSWALSWTGEGPGHSGPLSGSSSPVPGAGDLPVCGLLDASVLASCLAPLHGLTSTTGVWVLRPPCPRCFSAHLVLLPSLLPGLSVPVPCAVQGGLDSPLCPSYC